jgi:hypothetical protein
MSTVLNFLWNIVRNWINPATFGKIKFVKKPEDLLETINKEQIERMYGGLADDITNNYFPPTMPSDNYILPNEKEEDIHLTEDKYKELIDEGKLVTISPYFQNDSNSVYSVAYTLNQPNQNIKNESNII